MKTFVAIIIAGLAVSVAGCAIEQTHLLGTAWKDAALERAAPTPCGFIA